MEIEKIYCISLDKREEERTIDKDLAKYGYEVNLYRCGSGELFPLEYYNYVDKKVGGREQAYNYGSCMQNIFSIAKLDNLSNFLFLEDDCEINPRYKENFKETLENTLSQLDSIEEWDCLYFGGNIQEATEIVRPTDNIFKPNYMLDMQAVLWNRSSYDKILAHEPSNEVTLDGVIAESIRKGNLSAYCVLPVLITQMDNFSYNENRMVSRKENHIL